MSDEPTPLPPPVTVPAATIEAIRNCSRAREQDAHLVGVATLEWFRMTLERYQHIQQLLDDQKKIGELALRSLGLDPQQEELTIDLPTGEVRRLVAGQYEAVRQVPMKE